MNITKVDVDMNSLFNLTYSFEHLKLMLESMLNNQNAMVDKINELENRFNESDAKNDDLRRTVTEKQTLYEKKIRSVETYLKKNGRNGGKGGYVVSDVANSSNEGKGMNEGSIGEDTANANANANVNESGNVNVNEANTNVNDVDNNIRDNKDKKDMFKEGERERFGARGDGIDRDGSNYEDEEADFFSQGANGGVDVNEFETLKQRVNDLEKKTKNMNLLKFGASYNSNQNEKSEMASLEMKGLNEKVDQLRNKSEQMEKDIEEMKVKVLDFNVYDLFKDCKVDGGSLDASKLLIMNLERKVFKKIDLMDVKISKNEEDIYKLKNDFRNMKNLTDVNNKTFNNLKEDFNKIIEEIQNYNNENLNQLNSLDSRLTDKLNGLLKAFEKFKKETENDINELKGKPIEVKDNNEIGNVNIDNELDKKAMKDFNKRIIDVEKHLQILSASMKFADIIDDINHIKDVLKTKANQQDFFDLNDKLTQHTMQISDLKDVDDQLIDETTKHMESINSLSRTLEQINTAVITLKETVEKLGKGKSDSIDMSKYVDYATFAEHLKSFENEKELISKDFNEVRRLMSDLTEILKTKATDEDLKNLEEVLISKIDELRILCLKRFADKTETSKSIKYLDTQIKHIIEVYIKKQDKGDNWLIAKKPIGGYTCASCEAYIGDLKDREDYLAWNKYPMREPQDKAYRIGNGFSRMLNMLNIEVKGNYDTLDVTKEADTRNHSAEKKVMISGENTLPVIKPHKMGEQTANVSTMGGDQSLGDGVTMEKATGPNDPKVIKIYRKNKVNPIEIPQNN